MKYLNQACILKDLMMVYLTAAILDPVVNLVDEHTNFLKDILPQIANLFGICWWIYLLIDAFEFSDLLQQFRFADFDEYITEHPEVKEWFLLPSRFVDWRYFTGSHES